MGRERQTEIMETQLEGITGDFVQNENQEYVTKSEDEYYIIKITNLTTDNVPFNLKGFLYEESKGLD